jgi:hypothetical protein
VQDKTLVIKNTVLSQGICLAIKSVLGLVPNLIKNIALDSNSLQGDSL